MTLPAPANRKIRTIVSCERSKQMRAGRVYFPTLTVGIPVIHCHFLIGDCHYGMMISDQTSTLTSRVINVGLVT
jgi:hypothetical protein